MASLLLRDAVAPRAAAAEPAGPRSPGEIAEAHGEIRGTGPAFLDRRDLDALDAAIAHSRARLRTHPHDHATVRIATEWLLDNEYLVRQVLDQLRRELSARFQRRLPRLAAGGQVRALLVAGAIVDAMPELELAGIDRFLDGYQQRAPLTIAELWVLPALLRLVILRGLAELLAQATSEESGAPAPAHDIGAAASRAIRSLRLLADVDWREVFSRHSAVERLLAEDPALAYAGMDFDTRDAYRRAIEDIATGAGRRETDVARAVVARAAAAQPDGRCDHVGYWLIDAGRRPFERSMGAGRRRLLDHPRLTFFGILAAAQVLLLAPVVVYVVWLGASPAASAAAIVLCWIPSSVPAATIAHAILTSLVSPRVLPKLDFSRGIPARWRTLVAVPTMLGDDAAIDRLVAQLEVYYLANPDAELRFALLTDYVDSDEPPGERERTKLARAADAIDRLDRRYGARGHPPFYLLHRAPRWNPAEGKWMGWERKRGKLDELNHYLRGDTETSYTLAAGAPGGLDDVAFVITLDSDTELPPGTAARLAGTLAHPLNRPRPDASGRIRTGYTVIQPRVEIAPGSARRSAFSRLFAGDTGFDIYSRAVSEVYQDVFGQGIYVGKGIYDVDSFRTSLEGRVPENALVSHDLFEGIHGRVALASDVVVYEDYPPSYLAYLRRMHRWIRGDWQLVPWLLPHVPVHRGKRRNDLGALGRFQILDNLRRSLVAPAVLALLVWGWLVLPGHPPVWTLIALLAPGAAAVSSLVHATGLPRRHLGRWMLALCFAPQETRTVIDAVVRAVVRMVWTRKRMLEWTPASVDAGRSADQRLAAYLRALWTGPAAAVVVAGGLAVLAPDALAWASPWLVLWLASPVLARWISRPTPRVPEQLDEAARAYLRRIARRTWLFFETFAGPRDHWLPPDHYQEHPHGVTAHRTSPTNIAMLLLSDLAAYDLGYLGPVGLCSWIASTIDTVERLAGHRGHLYNWYDTRTLEPLEPRYVSTVDSGNLAGALIALAIGCEQAADDPARRPELRAGLCDAAELLAAAAKRWAEASPAARPVAEHCRALVDRLSGPGACDDALVADCTARSAEIETELLTALRHDDASHAPSLLRELRTWLDRFAHQLAAVRREPELFGLEIRGRLRQLAARSRRLAEAMDFRFLYDDKRRLFHVGYHASADRIDPHHYDLLASEARLASFLAIVWHQVPLEHWFALGRPLGRAGRGGAMLLSWGGSMFEYLMPWLLIRSDEDTLLHQSCRAAVERQIAYGRARGVPWGISESGYAFLDGQDNYQYRAFGVPGLGLRRGLEEDLVIAPYAALLALPFRARAVVDNLVRLESLGMLGHHGFYEAADFHPARAPGDRPALVFSYMAHHQGMGLVAIANHLTQDAIVERFQADPHVRGGALLVDERLPGARPAVSPPSEPTESYDVGRTPVAELTGWGPDRSTMQVWALGNDRLTSLVTADGGGGLVWRGLAVTRWEPDPVADRTGVWIYLRDLDTGEVFGATPAPLDGWPADARVRFEAGSIEFQRRHGELAIRLRIAVAAADDVEVRELEIVNEGDRPRRLEIVGCLEPVLEPRRSAERHPAFSRLFLQVSQVPELPGVVVSRRPRDERAAPVLLFHIVGERASAPRVLDIDREAFLGRRGTIAAPAALIRPRSERPADDSGPAAGPLGSVTRGATLDPLCACAAELVVVPGSRAAIALVTALATSLPEVIEIGRRFASPLAIRWAIDDAARAAAHRAERLAIPAALHATAQHLLSALLVPDPGLRAPPEVLATGRPSQRALWGRGISGDEPIVWLRMDTRDPGEILGDVLAVHRQLRALGVHFDLVIADGAPSGYAEPASQVVRRLLAARGVEGLLHQRGGIHVVAVDQLSPQQLADLEAAVSVDLDARRGPLARQLASGARPADLPRFTPPGLPPGAPPDPALAVDVPELACDCGIGGFAGDDYVVRPGAVPPAPWCNVIANERFGCLVSEGALGASWAGNAGENRLTPWHNDPVGDPASEVLYLRDEETARIWSTTPIPAGVPTLVRHGQGHSTYQLVCAGLDQTMTVFVPPGEPLKIIRLAIHNASARPRRLTATYYAEWVLGAHRSETRAHIRPDLSGADACLLAETAWSMDFAGRVAFLASDRPLHGCTTDRLEMIGRGGDLSRPAGLLRWGLSGRVAPGADPCAALQIHIDLGAGESTEVCFFLGQGDDRAHALGLVRALRVPGAVAEAWRSCRAYWDRVLGAVRVRTPDPDLDRMTNRWLLYQTLASRFLGRTGYYQPGGAFGFRDQLQDCLAFLHVEPGWTRRHLLEAAAHQFEDGDVLHWWHPPGGAGVRTRCSDDLLWLIYATAEYVAATGDTAVLAEPAPFLSDAALRPGENARYDRFPAGPSGSLLEHCRRAMTRGFTAGRHGLPLIGDGDWNDGMDRIGVHGRGESVWLGWFACACADRLATLLDAAGAPAEAGVWRERRATLAGAIAEHGWDGGWYLRAYDDAGHTVGSVHSPPPHIDSISQSWAILSGAGETARSSQALAAAERTLVREADRLVLLLAPPFGAHGPDPGYIAAYPPGVRENGGQYTHAAAWLGWAHAARGDGDAAHRIADLLDPLRRTRTPAEVARYRVEPYVLAGDIYAGRWIGRGGWTWYTGAAAWTWRLVIEEILGLRRRRGGLEVDPCLPHAWDGFEAWIHAGAVAVHVIVRNPDHVTRGIAAASLDGHPIEHARVELAGQGERLLEICLGNGGPGRALPRPS